MYFYNYQVVTQEVPGEISICFNITGCPHRCSGCHSPYLWNSKGGSVLSQKKYKRILDRYLGLATCILFMGGEWEAEDLFQKLRYAKAMGFKTCLYTGAMDVSPALKSQLSWLKTGRWNPEKGGLQNPSTNQEFIDVSTNKKLNHLFQNFKDD